MKAYRWPTNTQIRCLTSANHQGNANPTIIRYRFHCLRMAVFKKNKHQVLTRMWMKGTTVHYWWDCKFSITVENGSSSKAQNRPSIWMDKKPAAVYTHTCVRAHVHFPAACWVYDHKQEWNLIDGAAAGCKSFQIVSTWPPWWQPWGSAHPGDSPEQRTPGVGCHFVFSVHEEISQTEKEMPYLKKKSETDSLQRTNGWLSEGKGGWVK